MIAIPGPIFLTLDEVLALHEGQLRRYGGLSGLRDERLLASALGAVEATFDGAFLNEGVAEMAAAYLVNIVRNHPFLDGNKRTALACALTFLWMNDTKVEAGEDELVALVLAVAEGRSTKADVAVFLGEHVL